MNKLTQKLSYFKNFRQNPSWKLYAQSVEKSCVLSSMIPFKYKLKSSFSTVSDYQLSQIPRELIPTRPLNPNRYFKMDTVILYQTLENWACISTVREAEVTIVNHIFIMLRTFLHRVH